MVISVKYNTVVINPSGVAEKGFCTAIMLPPHILFKYAEVKGVTDIIRVRCVRLCADRLQECFVSVLLKSLNGKLKQAAELVHCEEGERRRARVHVLGRHDAHTFGADPVGKVLEFEVDARGVVAARTRDAPQRRRFSVAYPAEAVPPLLCMLWLLDIRSTGC